MNKSVKNPRANLRNQRPTATDPFMVFIYVVVLLILAIQVILALYPELLKG